MVARPLHSLRSRCRDRTDLLECLRFNFYHDTPSTRPPGPAKHLRSASLQCLNYALQSLDGTNLPWDSLVELNMRFEQHGHCPAPCAGHVRTAVVSYISADEGQLGVLREPSPAPITRHFLRGIKVKVIRAGLDAIFGAPEELGVCLSRQFQRIG